MHVVDARPLGAAEATRIDAYWRAANYLSVGQIYLMGNPLLREPLRPEQVKPRLLGHWGTTPGLNLLYAHLSRIIAARGQDLIYVTGPGHGGPGLVANAWLEGTYSQMYPRISADEVGMGRLFTQFSFPGGVPSHVAPETPGSIHEGGELGYSLSHAYGAALDNPDLVVACVIGDGEAETGPLAASWHSNKFLDPVGDGAVLPILHLNGYKIANPTVLARIGDDELTALLTGYGYKPYLVDGDDPAAVHQLLAATLDAVFDEIAAIQHAARVDGVTDRPRWPMIVLRTPKGWTGPKEVDGLPVEGTWRAHQVPLTAARDDAAHLALLEQWMRSYRPEELFDADGAPARVHCGLAAPRGPADVGEPAHQRRPVPAGPGAARLPRLRRQGRRDRRGDPGAGRLAARRDDRQRRAPQLPDRRPGRDRVQPARRGPRGHRQGLAGGVAPVDQHLGRHGRVMEILSEHTCQGWLEGYLLTGRHGLFSCYEAFVHIVDSMVNQHAKWLKTTRHLGWRKPIPSLNYLLTSHVWRQDHNGFSHQDPGFIDHVVNKKAEVVRVYLPPDANTLLSVADHCLRSRDYVNVIVAGKQPAPTWLDMDDAALHCARGLGIWDWAVQRRRRPRRRPRRRRRRPHPGDPRRRRPAPPAPARPEGPGRQRRRPDAPAARLPSTRTACPTPSSTRSSPPTGRSSSPTTATRG